MISAAKILSSYLRGLEALGGVRGLSIFVPSNESLGVASLFVKEGSEGIPEMSDQEQAAGLEQQHGSTARNQPPYPSVDLFPSKNPASRLFRVVADPALSSPRRPGEDVRRRQGDSTELYLRTGCVVWIGVEFEAGASPFDNRHLELDTGDVERVGVSADWWQWAVAFGGNLSQHLREVASILNDPVTGVPGRAQLQSHASRAFVKARLNGRPLTALLVSPDDFALVNQRYGHQEGDRVLKEIASRTTSCLRTSDFAARYGGAIFGVLLPDTATAAGRAVAEKLLVLLNEEPYLDGAIRLRFRAGMATFDPQIDTINQALDLTCRAEVALFNARRPGGKGLVLWETDLEVDESASQESIGGFFTGNMAKDYRNMQLLADIVRVVAGSSGFHELADKAVERLNSVLKPEHIALYEYSEATGLSLIKGRSHDQETLPSERPPAVRLSLLDEALRKARPLTKHTAPGPSSNKSLVCCAIPLAVGGEALGGLYMEGGSEDFLIDGADLFFLRSVASQLAVALDRAKLSMQEKRRQDQERQRLKAEVEELRQAVQTSNLEYRSEQMEAVMGTVRRVAATDATVLVTGESGTGKDMISRSLHQLSRRRKKPLVVVDCAAIPATLIESELFGHAKGAFSGAGQKRIGRLEQADGATIFLDEIGELPLEVQSKLLRFVQEKQLTPVGSSVTREVDARLIAATNRDLQSEVRAGRFREDLYYRLNVIRLSLPPLRERPEDILHLAYHYLRTYALLYHKDVVSFTHEAEALLAGYAWPGNVRELQNRIQQAVILADGTELGPEAMALDGPTHDRNIGVGSTARLSEPGGSESPSQTPSGDGATLVAPLTPEAIAGRRGAWNDGGDSGGTPRVGSPSDDDAPPDVETLLQRLRRALARYSASVVSGDRPPVPLGRWLGEDLVLEAHDACQEVSCRAAEVLGLPETTYRRRRNKAELQLQAGMGSRPDWWAEVRRLVKALLVRIDDEARDLDDLVQTIVLEEVAEVVGDDERVGAALVGVTKATYRRRHEKLQATATLTVQSG